MSDQTVLAHPYAAILAKVHALHQEELFDEESCTDRQQQRLTGPPRHSGLVDT